jgi:antitoxin VapB
MARKKLTEQDLLKGLDAHTAHADELADPLPQELTPLERLKGSVKHYDRPTESVWDEFFDADEGVSDDFMEDRDQVLGKALCNIADEPAPSGLRVAIKILDRWGCSPHEQAQILALSGSDSASGLSNEQLHRISGVLNLHAALRGRFTNPENVYGFMAKPNAHPVFSGHRPIDRLLNGDLEDFKMISRHIDRMGSWS